MLFDVDILVCIKAFWNKLYIGCQMLSVQLRLGSCTHNTCASSSSIAWTTPCHKRLFLTMDNELTFFVITQKWTGFLVGTSPQWSFASSWCNGGCIVHSIYKSAYGVYSRFPTGGSWLFSPGPVPSITYLCTIMGMCTHRIKCSGEHWSIFCCRFCMHSSYKIFFGDKSIYMCIK